MINSISRIFFLIGLIILIIVQTNLLLNTEKFSHSEKIKLSIPVIASIIFICVAWILKEVSCKKEKYNYNKEYQPDRIVSGTVYASYPEQTGGLGWVL